MENLEVDSTALVGTICTHFLKIPRTKKPASLAIPQMAKMLKLSLLMLFCIISRVRVLLCSTIMHILGCLGKKYTYLCHYYGLSTTA